MRLYGTITSERASKGQGGNKYLAISVQGTKPYSNTLLEMRMVPDNYGHATITSISGSISLLRAIVAFANEDIERQLSPKGKKQTGECEHPEVFNATGEYCTHCKEFIK